jgi:hypothetical protein
MQDVTNSVLHSSPAPHFKTFKIYLPAFQSVQVAGEINLVFYQYILPWQFLTQSFNSNYTLTNLDIDWFINLFNYFYQLNGLDINAN